MGRKVKKRSGPHKPLVTRGGMGVEKRPVRQERKPPMASAGRTICLRLSGFRPKVSVPFARPREDDKYRVMNINIESICNRFATPQSRKHSQSTPFTKVL